jgi:hypothetical protein
MDQHTTIEELDHRQEDVLQRLDELNSRIESLLNSCLKARDRALALTPDAQTAPQRQVG